MMPIRERIHNVIQDMERQVHLPGHIAVMKDVLEYLDSMDSTMKKVCEDNKKLTEELERLAGEDKEAADWTALMVAAYYNVVSEKLDDYGGNTAGLATYLQGVDDLASSMIVLSGQAEEDDD